MKLYKIALRSWIAVASVLGFLGGWALLAHSGKPVPFITAPTSTSNGVQTTSAQTTYLSTAFPNLPVVPTVQSSNGSSTSSNPVQLTVPSFQVNNNAPQVRTGAS